MLTAQEVARPQRKVSTTHSLTHADARHDQVGDCWTIFQGRVYDVRGTAVISDKSSYSIGLAAHVVDKISAYIDYHPGGKKQIMQGVAV